MGYTVMASWLHADGALHQRSLSGSARCLPAQGQVGRVGTMSVQGMLLKLGL